VRVKLAQHGPGGPPLIPLRPPLSGRGSALGRRICGSVVPRPCALPLGGGRVGPCWRRQDHSELDVGVFRGVEQMGEVYRAAHLALCVRAVRAAAALSHTCCFAPAPAQPCCTLLKHVGFHMRCVKGLTSRAKWCALCRSTVANPVATRNTPSNTNNQQVRRHRVYVKRI
jgi:hypothetical protein